MSGAYDCGHGGAGHGTDAQGKTFCYACCAERDKADMIRTGRATLYLTDKAITNWPGSLRFDFGEVRVGRHNIAGKRYDAWFRGPDGAAWHAVQYGDNTQICHCRRVKG